MRFALLACLLLAGCTWPDAARPAPTARGFKERHPDWPMEDCERLAAGKIWQGMTERQFLLLMMRRTGTNEWRVTEGPQVRLYQRHEPQETYVIDLSTGRLSDWVVKGR